MFVDVKLMGRVFKAFYK